MRPDHQARQICEGKNHVEVSALIIIIATYYSVMYSWLIVISPPDNSPFICMDIYKETWWSFFFLKVMEPASHRCGSFYGIIYFSKNLAMCSLSSKPASAGLAWTSLLKCFFFSVYSSDPAPFPTWILQKRNFATLALNNKWTLSPNLLLKAYRGFYFTNEQTVSRSNSSKCNTSSFTADSVIFCVKPFCILWIKITPPL